jgi:hypothetical protein
MNGQPAAIAGALRKRLERDDVWIPVDGPSMGHTIRPPAKVRVVGADMPRWGEIWAFTNEESTIVVHRYRGTVDGLHSFHGDGQLWRDRPVSSDHLIGRVVEDVQGGKRTSHAQRSRWVGTASTRLRRLTQRVRNYLSKRH